MVSRKRANLPRSCGPCERMKRDGRIERQPKRRRFSAEAVDEWHLIRGSAGVCSCALCARTDGRRGSWTVIVGRCFSQLTRDFFFVPR